MIVIAVLASHTQTPSHLSPAAKLLLIPTPCIPSCHYMQHKKNKNQIFFTHFIKEIWFHSYNFFLFGWLWYLSVILFQLLKISLKKGIPNPWADNFERQMGIQLLFKSKYINEINGIDEFILWSQWDHLIDS